MENEILNAVHSFERKFMWLLYVLITVIMAIVLLRVLVLDVPEGIIVPDYMLFLFLGICIVLSGIYLRIRCVMLRNLKSISDGYRNDVVMKRRAADIGWWCLMFMSVLLSVFIFIMNNI